MFGIMAKSLRKLVSKAGPLFFDQDNEPAQASEVWIKKKLRQRSDFAAFYPNHHCNAPAQIVLFCLT
eukprot:TRINITY_DN6634_c0_g1_i1.p2 TRINITY_DN6634_c0_g1~~TRINITY_DN6634_c0_g1_i1.p2  ORF type:complete len:67 (+),score=7.01 TRINITY_DN6634_c0_g1_i1:422-622(+)